MARRTLSLSTMVQSTGIILVYIATKGAYTNDLYTMQEGNDMTEAKLIRGIIEVLEEMQRRNASNVDVLGDWAEGRAEAFKLAADHCRNVLLYVLDENVSHLETAPNNEGDTL